MATAALPVRKPGRIVLAVLARLLPMLAAGLVVGLAGAGVLTGEARQSAIVHAAG